MNDKNEWPVLLLDEEKTRRNIRRMKSRADEAGCELRPHFKTHQSAEIGEWLREEGIRSITVSSFGMATYFAGAGWRDILIAMPVNILILDEINTLGSELDRLILMVDHADAVQALSGRVEADVVIEIDTGSERTGIPYQEPELAAELKNAIDAAEGLSFAGFYSHAGHTYGSRGIEEVRQTGNASLDRILGIRDKVAPGAPVYYGDTPYGSAGDRLSEISVMTPGNFVFYDEMQVEIGSCTHEDIAVCLACPVITVHPGRSELAIHGGGVHLAKDTLDDGSYGRIVRLTSDGWSAPLPGYKVKKISQEHGVVGVPDGEAVNWKIGDVLGILPVHSCMTAEAMGIYRTTRGGHISHYRKEKPA